MYHLRDWWCPLCLATSVHYVLKPDTVSRSSTNFSKNGLQASRGTATTRSAPSGRASASSCSKIPATRRDRWPESAVSQADVRSRSCDSHHAKSTASGSAADLSSCRCCSLISSRRAQKVSQSYSPYSKSRRARASWSSSRLIAVTEALRGLEVWLAPRRRFRNAACIGAVGTNRNSSWWIASSRSSLLNIRASHLGPEGCTADRFRRATWHP